MALSRPFLRVSLLLLVLWTGRAVAQCTGTPVSSFPYVEGFEAGPAWTSGGFGNDWAWGTPAHPLINSAGGGTNSWCVGGLTGTGYAPDALNWLESPCFDLSALDYPVISFKIFWETERIYDGMVLQYSLNGGTNWSNVGAFGDPVDCLNQNWYNAGSINNLDGVSPQHGWSGRVGPDAGNCAGGQGSGQWVTASHCLTGLAGQPSVKFRFLFGAGTICNNFDGIAIDDIRIEEQPQATAQLDADCTSGTPTFTLTMTQLCAVDVVWNFGDPASGAANTADGPLVQHDFSAPGSYTVTATATTPCGQQINRTQVFEVIDVQLIATSATCDATNGSLEAVVTGGVGPFTYQWDPALSNAALQTGLPAGTWTVTVLNAQGCAASATGTVTVGSSGLGVTATATDETCAGASDGTATAVVTGGPATSVSWSPSGAAELSISGLAPGTYTVTVDDADGCEASASVTVDAAPDLALSAEQPPPVCAGEAITLQATATGGTGPLTYTWSPDGPEVTPVQSGTWTVSVTDANGCSAGPVDVAVQVVSLSQPSLVVAPDTVCTGGCVAYQFVPQAGLTAAFDHGDGSTGNDPEHCFLTPGSYMVTLTLSDANGCSASTTAPVAVLPVPQALFAAPSVAIISEPPVTLMAVGGGATAWTWAIDGPGTAITADGPVLLFSPPEVGCYTVTHVAINSLGCADTTSGPLCVEDDFAVYAPNSFTPNDDAINDAFVVVTSVQRPELFELRIWDRWGREVFTGNAPEAGWDGSGWPVGIYAWTLRMRDSEGGLREARGHVTLLR